jgi:hypothetical protein
VAQLLAEFAEKHRKQVVLQQLSSASLLPVSGRLARRIGMTNSFHSAKNLTLLYKRISTG